MWMFKSKRIYIKQPNFNFILNINIFYYFMINYIYITSARIHSKENRVKEIHFWGGGVFYHQFEPPPITPSTLVVPPMN